MGWVISPDGEQVAIGARGGFEGNKTESSPLVTSGLFVYFQGIDNKLWSVLHDGQLQKQVGNNTTACSPFVVSR